MSTLEVVDRSDMIDEMKKMLDIHPEKTAVLTIDMHRGHLDPTVATMPCTKEDIQRVIHCTTTLLGIARKHGMPVIHLVVVTRMIPGLGRETMILPFYYHLSKIQDKQRRLIPGRETRLEEHNIQGSVQTELMPELYQDGDYLIKNKKRLDSFYGTELETLLSALRVDTTVIAGVNTNTCVLNTCFTAANKGFKVIAISDCVASMYGQDLHTFALQNIARCIGWVLTVEEFKQRLQKAPSPRL